MKALWKEEDDIRVEVAGCQIEGMTMIEVILEEEDPQMTEDPQMMEDPLMMEEPPDGGGSPDGRGPPGNGRNPRQPGR